MGAISKVFILHGWTYSTEKWKPFIDLIKKNGFEPHMLNIPGLTEKVDSVWNIRAYVRWLNEILNKEKSKVILLGHSNGGRIALNFAIKYPQKLTYLILIDSAGIYHNDLFIIIKRLLFKNIAKIGTQALGRAGNFSETLKILLYKIAGESDYKNATLVVRQTMVNLINSDKTLNLDKITTSALIIWGEDDKITPLSDGKLMNKLIKNSKLHVVDNAKHSPQFTNTQEVVDIISKYEYF